MAVQAVRKWFVFFWLGSAVLSCGASSSGTQQATAGTASDSSGPGAGGTSSTASPGAGAPTTASTPPTTFYHENPTLSSGQNDPIVQGYALGVPVNQNNSVASSLPGGFSWVVPDNPPLYGASAAPMMDDVVQGVIGDCYLDAAIGAILNTSGGAGSLADLIEPAAAAGTYTVSLYVADNANLGPVPLLVNASWLQDVDGYVVGNQAGNGNAIWAQLLEKAYVIYAGQGDATDANGTYPISSIDDHGAAEGVGFATIKAALFALTGRISTNMKIATTSEAGVKAALAQAGMVPTVANTTSSDATVGLSAPHVYTVVGFDSASDTVTLRDPHGVNSSVQTNGDGHGSFSLSYAAFQNHVDAVTVLPQ